MKTVIIGGGASGASTATRLRRLDEEMEILIVEKTDEISIANCGLPYYISDVISDRNNLLVSSVQKFKNQFNIDVKLNTTVAKINRKEKYIETQNNEQIKYDKLVLALGASPIVPNFDGLDKNKPFVLRTLKQAEEIKSYIKNNNVKKAVVVGGGFIGIEVAENLRELNLDTSIVELQNQILAPVDKEIATIAQSEMERKGIHLYLGNGVSKFNNNKVVLNSSLEIEFDIVIFALGIKPEISLAKEAGLNTNYGIITDDNMKTNDENIYCAGDSVEVRDFISDINTLTPLAGPANRQGRIIADNICGIKSKYNKTQGTSVVKVFDLSVATVGNNEKQLINKNIPYWKTFVYGYSHASYYKNASRILYKLLFNNDGKILGAQGIGYEGVEKRIDVISAIMRCGGTIQDMIDFEQCYAPPYASAKDIVNTLGMNASNILRGFVKPAFIEDMEHNILIDVRPKMMFEQETINGAINIPITELRNRYSEIPKDKKVILFCNTGYTSYLASRILIQKGFNNVYSFMGGIELYKELSSNYGKIKSIKE